MGERRRRLVARLTDTVNREWNPEILPSTTDALTCMPPSHVHNLMYCCASAMLQRIEGDFFEAGVWRGGGAIAMASVLMDYPHEAAKRKVWLADSFAGMPLPEERYPSDSGSRWHPGTLRLDGRGEWLVIDEHDVRESLQRFKIPDEMVRFRVGFFSHLSQGPLPSSIAVLHLDSDMYASTYQALQVLYPLVSVGGYVVEDDYQNPGFSTSREAVRDYMSSNNCEEAIYRVEGPHAFAAWWRKSGRTG